MKLSTRLSQYDSLDTKAEIEKGEVKRLTFAGHEYVYRIDKYTLFKDYNAIVMAGGPHKIRATTTCKKGNINKVLKKLIRSLKHK